MTRQTRTADQQETEKKAHNGDINTHHNKNKSLEINTTNNWSHWKGNSHTHTDTTDTNSTQALSHITIAA